MAIYTSVCTVCHADFGDKLSLRYHSRECYHKIPAIDIDPPMPTNDLGLARPIAAIDIDLPMPTNYLGLTRPIG